LLGFDQKLCKGVLAVPIDGALADKLKLAGCISFRHLALAVRGGVGATSSWYR
jgi:hypothetical protein